MKRQSLRVVVLALAAVWLVGCGSATLLFEDVRRLVIPPGSLDESFGTGGIVIAPMGPGGNEANSVTMQTDGKIVAAGYATNGGINWAVARFTSSGELDGGFGADGKVTTSLSAGDDYGYAVATQADGKIVVAGTAWIGIGDYAFGVARYNADGTPDSGFSGDGALTTNIGSSVDYGMAVAIQSDGKIVVAGFATVGANEDFAVVRYDSAGSPDGEFGAAGIVTTSIGSGNARACAVAVQPDGKVVAAGYYHNGSNYDLAVVRYQSTGALDGTFGVAGIATAAMGTGMYTRCGVAIQKDGKIVVGTTRYTAATGEDFAVVRFTSDGDPDPAFGTAGVASTAIAADDKPDAASGVALQSDGKIVVAGLSRRDDLFYDYAVVRYTAAGALDHTFGAQGVVVTPIRSNDNMAFAVVIQADDRIVVAGFASTSTATDFALVRYWP